jgi:hypothetical protein
MESSIKAMGFIEEVSVAVSFLYNQSTPSSSLELIVLSRT